MLLDIGCCLGFVGWMDEVGVDNGGMMLEEDVEVDLYLFELCFQ